MALVEEAEKRGYKEKNLVSAILERLTPSFGVGMAGVDVSADIKRPGTANSEPVLKRHLAESDPVWIFVDDIDQNFSNTTESKDKVASFFVACREVLNEIPQLRIRASVRPNVWTTVKLHYEALSHVEQYIVDLTWSEDDQRRLLAQRVEGYLNRHGHQKYLTDNAPVTPVYRDKWLISQIFDDPMQWGSVDRPPHVLLHTLSKHRPRWNIELCKVSARRASGRSSEKIQRSDIFAELTTFGTRRITDTVAEFRQQCPEVEELIQAFIGGAEEYSTAELVDLIRRKILDHLVVHIPGMQGGVRELDVAALLFQIGFIYARQDLVGGSYRHYTFSEKPALLRNRTNVDEGVRWEVHPVFRQALGMRDDSGAARGVRAVGRRN